MQTNKSINIRGDDDFLPGYKLTMQVNLNLDHRKFDDYINSVDMWLTENSEEQYSIHVTSVSDYNIPAEIELWFKDPEDAAYFKLGPLWDESNRT